MTSQSESRALGAATTRRRLALFVGLKAAAVLALDFVLLRLWAPDLVNLHSDLALAGALACVVVAAAATGWLVLQLRLDWSRWGRLGPHAVPGVVEWREK